MVVCVTVLVVMIMTVRMGMRRGCLFTLMRSDPDAGTP